MIGRDVTTDLEAMQWTDELNALLNQCVFASSYDFEASRELFCQQVAKLRLWRGNEALALTANQCQEQWMLLNPTEDEDDDGENHSDDIEQVKDVADVANDGPRLEVLLSDVELDQLLSTMPRDEEPIGVVPSVASDTKAMSLRSEMQWVLAFLTNPDAIASVDAEAKHLVESRGQHDDDNYQGFLQGLQKANLLAPPPISRVDKHCPRQLKADDVAVYKEDDVAVYEEEDDSSDDQADWEYSRQTMKHLKKLH